MEAWDIGVKAVKKNKGVSHVMEQGCLERVMRSMTKGLKRRCHLVVAQRVTLQRERKTLKHHYVIHIKTVY